MSRPSASFALLLLIVTVLAVLFALFIAGDRAPGSAAPSEVQLADRDNGGTVRLASGGTLIVALASNPSTGYAWAVSESSGPGLTLSGEPQYVPPGSTGPVVGAAGTEVFRFVATGVGTQELVLEYRRSFEPGRPPASTFSVTVQVE